MLSLGVQPLWSTDCSFDCASPDGTLYGLEDSPQLTSWTIFRFYSPLAVSWLFMGLEGPICEGVINRMAHPEISAAAWPVMMSIAIWLESPVIDLLSTSTTLAKDRQRYVTLSRFVWYLLLWVTVIHAVIAFSPLYTVMAEGMMGVEHSVATTARVGLMILTPWSALIGWRRYLQGILIRHGQTRSISVGTTARVLALLITSITLYQTTHLPSMVIASTAIMAGVTLEASVVHWLSRDVIARHFGAGRVSTEEPLSMKKLVSFHFPLTATTMVNLLVMPLVSAGLARTPNPVLALAGCGVAGAIIFLHRAVTFCLPEVVITLYKNAQSLKMLRTFSLGVGAASSLFILISGLTGMDRFLFSWLIDAKPAIAEVAHWCYLLSAAVPFVDAAQAYVRGVLTAHHLTVSRLVAVVAAISVLIGVLAIGVGLHWSGPVLAAASVTSGLLAELAVLAMAWARAKSHGTAMVTI